MIQFKSKTNNPSKFKQLYNNNPSNIKWLGLLFFLFLYPLWVTFCTEFIQRENFSAFMEWFDYGSLRFYLAYLIVLLTSLFFYSVTPRLWIGSLLTAFLFFSMGLINFFKMNYRGEPFLPWDLGLAKEALGILPSIEIKITLQIFLILVIFAFILISFKSLNRFIFPKKSRLFLSVSSVFLLCILFSNIILNTENLALLEIKNLQWNQAINYKHNGVLTGFFMNIRNIVIQSPENYNRQALEALMLKNDVSKKDSQETVTSVTSPEAPNVIMVMGESLSDPTRLPNVSFSTDPIPNINKIRSTGISGDLLVSEYGGGTSNTEFEVLTGHKTMYLPLGSVPYQQYVKRETFALPSYLRNLGYDTLAIHPYEKWFWDRDKVYPLIGFNEFIGDVDITDPIIKGNYISDESAAQEVIKNFEKKQGNPEPLFTFLVTMQNHAAYEIKNYSELNVMTDAPGLSEQNQLILQNYVQGVYDTDAALGKLMDYFSNVSEPTMIILFGDHLPALGNDYEIYRHLGYAEPGELSPTDYINLYTTPFVIWKNYDLEAEDHGIVDANLLSALALESANIDLPPYWKILLENEKRLPNQNNFVKFNQKEETFQNELNGEETTLIDDHWLMEYDTLFGNESLEDCLF